MEKKERNLFLSRKKKASFFSPASFFSFLSLSVSLLDSSRFSLFPPLFLSVSPSSLQNEAQRELVLSQTETKKKESLSFVRKKKAFSLARSLVARSLLLLKKPQNSHHQGPAARGSTCFSASRRRTLPWAPPRALPRRG